MSTFNFSPIISKVSFFPNVHCNPEEEITGVVNIDEIDKMLLYFTLTGLSYTFPPVEYFGEREVDFYINVATINQRGGRTSYFSNSSLRINKEEIHIENDSVNILTTVFSKFEPEGSFHYDLLHTFITCVIFFSDHKIENKDEIYKYITEPYYVLYSTKIPLIGGKINGK
ncbi:hypothetical protein ACV7JQ_08990 [Globicatella sulfidifaciens]